MSNKDRPTTITFNGQPVADIQGDLSFWVDDEDVVSQWQDWAENAEPITATFRAPVFAITAIVPPGSNVDAGRIREVLNVPAHIPITVREWKDDE